MNKEKTILTEKILFRLSEHDRKQLERLAKIEGVKLATIARVMVQNGLRARLRADKRKKRKISVDKK